MRRSHRNWKCLLSLKWNCFESEGHPATPDAVVRLLRQGNQAEALRVFSDQILAFIHLFGLGDEVSNTKALFKQLGIFRSDEARLPLLRCTPERLREVMLAYEQCVSNSRARAGRPAGQA